MRLRQTLALAIALLCSTFTAAAAGKCQIDEKAETGLAPFHLGMNIEAIQKLYPDAEVKYSQAFGTHLVVIRNPNPGPAWAVGADYVSLSLTDDRLVSVTVAYDRPQWKSLEGMRAYISRAWALPRIWPRTKSDRAGAKRLICGARTIEVERSGAKLPYWLSLSETGWAQKDAKRFGLFNGQEQN